MSKKKRFQLTEDALRILMILFGSAISTVVLIFSIFAIQKVQAKDLGGAGVYLMLIFITLSFSRLLTFFKEKSLISLIRFITLVVIDVILGFLCLFAKNNVYFYDLVGGLFCIGVIISRIFKIIQKHTIRSIVYNAIIIVFAILLATGLFLPSKEGTAEQTVLVLCLIIIATAVIEVIASAAHNLKLKVLAKIVVRTFALEIILGLGTMIVAFSLVFTLYEPNIPSFYDGLWYSFAVVTTIGFGDFAAVSPVGRALTVILGLYGLIVVAVITSIIVNFYNETAGKKDSSEFKQIDHEENKKKK